MKALKIFEKFEEKSDPIADMGIGIGKLNIYTEVWAIITNGDSEIYEIYLKKEYALRECEKINKQTYVFNQHRKAEVKSLGDAIDLIKDVVRDNAEDPGEDY